ncbi:ANXA6 protein, partial [Polypterus senegalus]
MCIKTRQCTLCSLSVLYDVAQRIKYCSVALCDVTSPPPCPVGRCLAAGLCAHEVDKALAGSDKETILDLITSRSNAQRQEICTAYKSLYGKDLIGDLKYELTGKFERLIIGLMRPPAYHDAKEIKDAIEGIGTDEKCLIEILASRNNKQIHNLVNAYKDAYGRSLEDDVIGDTSGHFKKMLVVLLQGTREEDDVVSEDLVAQDAQELYEAGEAKWGTDEAKFITILGNRSVTHLQLVFDEYQRIAEKEIEDSIRGELSGDFERLMLAVVDCIRSVPMYFAKRLYKSMKGLGTADNSLIRIMVSRAEIDMLDIREMFRLRYEKSLYSMIKLRGTIRPAADFNPQKDAEALRKAMKGFGKYNLGCRKNLMADFKSEISGEFCKLVLGLMMTPAQFDAKQMKKAMEGAGTNEKALIEILATRNNQEILAMNEAYKEAYHKSLEDAITSDTSGHFCRVLVSLVQGNREEGQADLERAEEDAKELSDGCNDDSNSMETRFMSILCTRSYPHLRKVFQEFVKCTNKDIEQVIRKAMSGDLKDAFIAIVQSVKNMPTYFADRLYKSMKGLGTDERTLTRIMVSRSEIDLLNIRREYKELSDVSLHESIKGDTSGDYRKALLLICGGED